MTVFTQKNLDDAYKLIESLDPDSKIPVRIFCSLATLENPRVQTGILHHFGNIYFTGIPLILVEYTPRDIFLMEMKDGSFKRFKV